MTDRIPNNRLVNHGLIIIIPTIISNLKFALLCLPFLVIKLVLKEDEEKCIFLWGLKTKAWYDGKKRYKNIIFCTHWHRYLYIIVFVFCNKFVINKRYVSCDFPALFTFLRMTIILKNWSASVKLQQQVLVSHQI